MMSTLLGALGGLLHAAAVVMAFVAGALYVGDNRIGFMVLAVFAMCCGIASTVFAVIEES